MRGEFRDQGGLFSYIDPESRIPADHPLRQVRTLVRAVLKDLSRSFSRLYSHEGRPSIPPEQLLSALLLQVLYGLRSERQLMEQLDYNLLFRWFERPVDRRHHVARPLALHPDHHPVGLHEVLDRRALACTASARLVLNESRPAATLAPTSGPRPGS